MHVLAVEMPQHFFDGFTLVPVLLFVLLLFGLPAAAVLFLWRRERREKRSHR